MLKVGKKLFSILVLATILNFMFVNAETYNVVTLAGNGGTGSKDGEASNSTFDGIEGVALDYESGNVYIGGNGNRRVRLYNPTTNQVSTFAGNGTAGNTDGPISSATLGVPVQLTFDSLGNLYVCDWGNHNIRKITKQGQISTFAGSTVGISGYADGLGTNTLFKTPLGIICDSNNTVYVGEENGHRVRKITPAGLVSTLAGSGTAGYLDGQGTAAQFWGLSGIALDSSNNLFVGEMGNCRIRKITPTGLVTTFAGIGGGWADGPSTVAMFNLIRGISFDHMGNLYVSEWGNRRIRRVSPSGNVITVAGSGIDTFADGEGTMASFSTLGGIQFDQINKELYIADRGSNVRLRRMTICPDYAPFDSVNKICKCGSTAVYDPPSSLCLCKTNIVFNLNDSCVCSVGQQYNIGKTQCVSCPAGKYRASILASNCTDCPPGTESAADKISCSICPSGKYRPSAMFTSCIDCPLFGTCNTTSITTCQAGFKINSAGSGCEQCSVGTESSSDTRSCVSCISGSTYRNLLSQTVCQPCPLNSICTPVGFTCNAGYELTGDGLGCQICSEGYSKSASGNYVCTQCSIGTESTINKHSCSSCASGKYRPSTSFNKCIPCPQNGVCTATALTCNAGYKLNTSGDGCDQCSVGQQSNAGYTDCVACTSGTNYRSSLSQNSCIACPTNAACAVSGFACDAGYEPTADGVGCQICADGYSKSASGSAVCTQCSVGTESSADKQTCINCASGYYRSSLSYSKCMSCPSGATCSSSSITRCPNGFKINTAGDGCDQCPIGHDSTDGINCVGCISGYFKPDQSYSMCVKCPDGSSTCGGSLVICQSGYYFDSTMQCKRNDSYFGSSQVGINIPETVTRTFISTTIAQFVTVSIGSANNARTITVSPSIGNSAQQGQSANSVTVDFLGTLPISPLIFGAACLGAGFFIMLIFALICCRKSPQRRKDDEFDGAGMTTTGINTTSQRTFTNSTTMR